ncbi:SDR family NAD(P)-dependent oxidoreductase [Novosphingobium marinum]|uniref:NAD(P)-dependent dehydrogenase (Short-subunit alcohol dehydrogenase family) n=1 Tax=Novosphingobium marinum TaxID=1514948 RepID=A0A7Z0BTY8_9SPHN|nr:glucose 1-dehydrogenase [Novosphingobium marinum]NYH94608.1 NAD(P)-dependent dehydrogenase (short-subunit alcohol dehydrogenase family) [Novosphingobium marinum]
MSTRSDLLAGRVIMVTGGGNGIGRASALRCAEAGAAVAVTDRDLASAEAVAREIADAGGMAYAFRLDVTLEEEVREAVEKAVSRFGKLDGACNAAGATFKGVPMHEVDTEFWDFVHAVNLRGLFLSMKYQVAAMLDAGAGSVVNIASTAAIAAIPSGSEYCSAKAGVAGMTRAAAIDYARSNIRVNAVLPGGTRTAMMEHAFDLIEELREMVPEANPMGRLAEPDEMAMAVRWLLSDEASFVNGVLLPVDGGLTAQ